MHQDWQLPKLRGIIRDLLYQYYIDFISNKSVLGTTELLFGQRSKIPRKGREGAPSQFPHAHNPRRTLSSKNNERTSDKLEINFQWHSVQTGQNVKIESVN